jgi:hypothetical protein
MLETGADFVLVITALLLKTGAEFLLGYKMAIRSISSSQFWSSVRS